MPKVEELVILLIIILVLFGAKKLPELSKGIADSVREVRKGFKDDVPAKPEVTASQTTEKPQTKV